MSLVTDPGFLWLKEQELGHWQTQLATYIGQAAGDTDDTLALQKIRQVVAAHKAVQRVFDRPAQELQKLTHAVREVPPVANRGGY